MLCEMTAPVSAPAKKTLRSGSRPVGIGGLGSRPFLTVTSVVSVGSEIEMIEPNARGVVAVVQHTEAVGDRAILQLPRETVGTDHVAVAEAEGSVPGTATTAAPLPTVLGLSDVLPEPLHADILTVGVTDGWPGQNDLNGKRAWRPWH